MVTGFPFHDGDGEAGLALELARFLDDGTAAAGLYTRVFIGDGRRPIFPGERDVGRPAAWAPGWCAFLIDPRNRPTSFPEGVIAFDYAPFSALFPRAELVVHHGGIGTTGLAMRSGRPMLIVPRATTSLITPSERRGWASLGGFRLGATPRIVPSRSWTDCSMIRGTRGGRRRSARRCEMRTACGWLATNWNGYSPAGRGEQHAILAGVARRITGPKPGAESANGEGS